MLNNQDEQYQYTLLSVTADSIVLGDIDGGAFVVNLVPPIPIQSDGEEKPKVRIANNFAIPMNLFDKVASRVDVLTDIHFQKVDITDDDGITFAGWVACDPLTGVWFSSGENLEIVEEMFTAMKGIWDKHGVPLSDKKGN